MRPCGRRVRFGKVRIEMNRLVKKDERLFRRKIVPEAEELKRLRKELADVRMERDILKKAMVYFAKDER